MSISQDEAVSLLNHTIFRPGWKVVAEPAPGNNILIGVEIETVDTSFVTRGGDYKVPLTEQAFAVMAVGDYATPEALLFRTLVFIQGLEEHEDREFLRVWDSEAERWVAPFHSHNPEGQRAWDRARTSRLANVSRISSLPDGPWAAVPSPCNDQTDDDDDIDGPQRRLVAALRHAGSDPCTEDHGGCAGVGKR